MTKPFLIEGPERQQFELAADRLGYFVSHYEPQGFWIVDPAPTGYGVPTRDAVAEAADDLPQGVIVNGVNLSAMKRTELDAFATEQGVPDPDKLPNKDAVIEAIVVAVDPEQAV